MKAPDVLACRARMATILVVLVATIGPAIAQSQQEPNLIVRLPSFKPIQEIVIPAIADAQNLDDVRLGRMLLVGLTARMDNLDGSCFGARSELWLDRAHEPGRGARLQFDINEKTVILGASPLSGNRLRLKCSFDSPSTDLNSGVTLLTKGVTIPEKSSAPTCGDTAQFLDPRGLLLGLKATLGGRAHGLSGDLVVTIKGASGRLELDQVESFKLATTPSLDGISDVFDAVTGALRGLGLQVPSFSSEFTKAVNNFVNGQDAQTLVQNVVRGSIKPIGAGVEQMIPVTGQSGVRTTVSLAGLSAISGGALSQWRVSVLSDHPTYAMPEFRQVPRTGAEAGPAGQLGTGDLAVSVPLALIDHVIYEACRTGLLDGPVNIPPAPSDVVQQYKVGSTGKTPARAYAEAFEMDLRSLGKDPGPVGAKVDLLERQLDKTMQVFRGGIGRGMIGKIEVLEAPVVLAGSNAKSLVLEGRVRLTTAPSTASGKTPVKGLGVLSLASDQDKLDATATIHVGMRVDVGEAGAIMLSLGNATLSDVTGQLTLFGQSKALGSDTISTLATAVSQRIARNAGPIVVRGDVDLPTGLRVQTVDVSVSGAYVTASFKLTD